MGENKRNRSQGWRHAKLDGHANEHKVAATIKTNKSLLDELGSLQIGKSWSGEPTVLDIGQSHVRTIFDDQSLAKPDLVLDWGDEGVSRISIKKSISGQAWLVTLDRFLRVIAHYRPTIVTSNLKLGLSLFIGGDVNLAPYIDQFKRGLNYSEIHSPRVFKQEAHQKRLSAQTIEAIAPVAWKEVLDFFQNNIDLITELTLAAGVAKSKDDWAEYVLYTLNTGTYHLFSITEILKKIAESEGEYVEVGPRNGGTTLLLPFGFLQMHKNSVQFHHKLESIQNLYLP